MLTRGKFRPKGPSLARYLAAPTAALRRSNAVASFAWVALVALGANTGCAAPPPCRCTCETCGPAGSYPVAPSPALATDAGAEASIGAPAPDSGVERPVRRTKAGETLSEQQLLQRYEGKSAVQVLNGKATYYANSLAGRKTASGEVYDPAVFSAAHRTLPFGTVVRVVRTDTNKYVYVRITDRGPFAGGGRIIDLSYVAAQRLGMIRAGVVPVRVEVLR